jgi:hypothetical protein
MREYIHTTPIETLQQAIADGMAKADEIARWTAEPPILPSWKVVELEAVDIPEFIEKGFVQYGNVKLDDVKEFTDDEGNRCKFRMSQEVAFEIDRQVKAQQRAAYDVKVRSEVEKSMSNLLKRLKDSPAPARGLRNEAERWKRILEGLDTKGLSENEINIRIAYEDILDGNRYVGGEDGRHGERGRILQQRLRTPVFLPRYTQVIEQKKQVDNRLRQVYITAEAAHKFLQWLKALQAVVAYFDFSQNHTPHQLKALEELEQARTPLDFEALALPKATPSDLQALLNAKFEAYGKAQRLTLREFAAHELKRLHEIPHWADLAPLLPIAQQWSDYLTTIAETPDPDMIAGQAFAFTADGKPIEKPTLQTIVEYFNEQGAEVQLCANVSNEEVVLSGQVLKDNTDLEADAREADPSELQALFDAKFKEARDSNRFRTPQAFAKAEAKRLRKAWADDADRFPIAEQWFEHLERMASETATGYPAQPERANTPPQGSEDGTGAEIEPETLEGTRESVVGILDPLQVAFLSTRDFEDAVTRLCKYFDGEEQQAAKPLNVRKRNYKKLGKALGEIFRDMRHRDSIGRDYLQFAKDTFDCFEGQDISNEKLTSTTLYKYMTNKS